MSDLIFADSGVAIALSLSLLVPIFGGQSYKILGVPGLVLSFSSIKTNLKSYLELPYVTKATQSYLKIPQPTDIYSRISKVTTNYLKLTNAA